MKICCFSGSFPPITRQETALPARYDIVLGRVGKCYRSWEPGCCSAHQHARGVGLTPPVDDETDWRRLGSVLLPSPILCLQVVSCLGMLLEGWNPFPVDEGSRGARGHEETATRNVRTVFFALVAKAACVLVKESSGRKWLVCPLSTSWVLCLAGVSTA